MYAPGKKISFGCGNPFWGASTDLNFELERRPKWPENGHTKTTFEFYKKVFNSSNVMVFLLDIYIKILLKLLMENLK